MPMVVQGDGIVREKFQRELRPGESILWAGKPASRLYLSTGDMVRIVWNAIGVVLMLFLVAATFDVTPHGHAAQTTSGGGMMGLRLLLLVFVAVGFASALWPFTYKRWKKANTYYAVTNARVLALSEKPFRSLQSTAIADIPPVTTNVRRNGIGTVDFGNSASWQMLGFAGPGEPRRWGPPYPILLDIPDANSVYDLVQQLRNAHLKSRQMLD